MSLFVKTEMNDPYYNNGDNGFIYESDDSNLDGVIPFGMASDSEGSVGNNESPPNSPIVIDPYVNPDGVTAIPHVLENWRMFMDWPQYEQPPFEPRDFPITREPPHHTVPLLVAKVHELEGKLAIAEYELEGKASQQSISITRDDVRDGKEDFTKFGVLYNENLQILESLQNDHNELVDGLNENRAIDDKRRKALKTKVKKMGKTIARLEAEKPSTSSPKKKKKTKKT